VTGRGNWFIRGGFGIFYDRPDGNTVFSIPGNPPAAMDTDLFNGTLVSAAVSGCDAQPGGISAAVRRSGHNRTEYGRLPRHLPFAPGERESGNRTRKIRGTATHALIGTLTLAGAGGRTAVRRSVRER